MATIRSVVADHSRCAVRAGSEPVTGFLFGKLPAFGDFVSRGLSARTRDYWDTWCTSAVLDARSRFEETLDQRFCSTEPRRFLAAPSEGGCWQTGCIVASSDRAGRAFPFILGVSSFASIEPGAGAVMGERIAACLQMLPEASVDLDALVVAAATAAKNVSGARLAVDPIDLREGWIGEIPTK